MVVAVGASAGGVEALWTFLAALPNDLPAAVVVVLHIPPHTPTRLDRVLQQRSALPVKIAEDGETLALGTVYVAREDHHLMVDGSTILVARGPKECRVRPSVNVLFRSIAESCGTRAIGVVLSGALDDGTAGAWIIKRKGGHVFAQAPDDAFCDSMPGSVAAHVAVDGVASAQTLAQLVEHAVLRAKIDVSAPITGFGIESQLAAGDCREPADVFQLGAPSRYACPECRGVLARIEEGNIVRFRCHTGHGYSQMTLAAALDRDIHESLWSALRALEEKILLMQARASDGEEEDADLSDAKSRREALRRMLLLDRP